MDTTAARHRQGRVPAPGRSPGGAWTGVRLDGIELRIVDPETGAVLPDGQIGGLRVSADSLMRAYDQAPEANAAAFDEDGWFRTGDLALIGGDGHLIFRGRQRDVLKVGWENVSPAEIEAFLLKRADVAEAVVVGIPDAELGEVPVAVIVAAPDSAPNELEIRRACRGRIAAFKFPRRVLIVDELPTTASRKIRRNAVRDEVLAAFATDG